MEEVPSLLNISPTKPIQILNQHECFWRFCIVLQMILLAKITDLDVGTGAPQQGKEVY